MTTTFLLDNAPFVREILNTAPALGVDEFGVWLLDLRVGTRRWHVEAVPTENGNWRVLSMTSKIN